MTQTVPDLERITKQPRTAPSLDPAAATQAAKKTHVDKQGNRREYAAAYLRRT
jgi:hypothetical protein